MSRRATELTALARVTDAAFAADQARMAALRRREAEIRAHLAELMRPRHDPTTPIELDAALRAGADLNWQLWVDARRNDLNVELARVLVAQSAARKGLALSFGRNMAAEKLRDAALVDARIAQQKRRDLIG